MFLRQKRALLTRFPLFMKVFCHRNRDFLLQSAHTNNQKLKVIDGKMYKNELISALKRTRWVVGIFEGKQFLL